ncbi:tubulin-specific chaperone E isoform X2 [Orussus abietinus]|uniref:tubulin-specific chaperone E isoform X2 n=1 Tax=Orussus abietinus TaxID=222816 RepID=UPI0006257751|nr:tubulin-specific chaperone E isoform X2 [Orussus abietinus]
MVEDKFKIGSRVECDGYRGTLKYVGPVGNTKGQWFGIDWDDVTRGKHNGTYENVEYFKARHPTSGSFVRPGKVRFGVTCPEAIKLRYGLIDDELVGIDKDNLDCLQKEINAPFLEMVGFAKVNKKQSRFDQLKIVWLREQALSDAGEPGELQELCPNIEEIDLSRNLISSWQVVADICCQLHRLTQLDVSENQLPIEENMETLKEAFSRVKSLTMARMNYTWSDIQHCIVMFPCIKQLSVSFNIVQYLETPEEHSNMSTLAELTLEGNLLSNWDEILKLGHLPSLEYLNLNSNKINKIHFPTNNPTEKTNLFPALKQLHISGNNISEWQSISELEKLVSLKDLKFRENPILKNESIETGRQIIIAKISNLKSLNGTEVSCEERRGAEYDYLKLFGPQWIQCESNPEARQEFIKNHPRYPALVEKYGSPDIPVIKTNSGLVSNVIFVEFVCPDDPTQSKGIKRKLLKDMELQKVCGLVQRLFKTGGKIPILTFVQRNLSPSEIPLDKPLQKLSYYSLQDGDQIMVRW